MERRIRDGRESGLIHGRISDVVHRAVHLIVHRRHPRFLERVDVLLLLDLFRVLQFLLVKDEINAPRSDLRQLSAHDVFRDSVERFVAAKQRSLEKHVQGFLEAAAQHRSRRDAVDPMAVNRHQRAAESHDVAKNREVSTVDIRCSGDQVSKHEEKRRARSFDPEDHVQLVDVIRRRARRVNALERQGIEEVGPIRRQLNFILGDVTLLLRPRVLLVPV